MLKSPEFTGIRGFAELRLADLGRVNLIVGRNNTGKTSLLEGVALLADPMTIERLPGLFQANAGSVDERFYRWLPRDGAAEGARLAAEVSGGDVRVIRLTRGPEQSAPGLERVKWGRESLGLWQTPGLGKLRAHAVSVQHSRPEAMIDAFAAAVRAPVDERQMEALLAAVDSRIRTVRLDAVEARPFVAVDVGLSERIPLPQAGQGIYRLVAIFSELLGNKPQVCFIDEFENGIHHSALADVWRGIAEVSERLGIQIFATTHSWRCLVAAHEAFAPRDYALRVIQLYPLEGTTSGRVLDRAHIEAAIAGEIEVR